jgi:hypothetical protein
MSRRARGELHTRRSAPGDGDGFREADDTGWLILVEPTLATGPFV